MFSLPSHVLEKLRCAQCRGYLSSGPIVANRKNEQLCGRCFKIFPDERKAEYLRQIGLEAVAQIIIFPCKYTDQGCTHTFPWNNGLEHELNCEHRYDTLPLIGDPKCDKNNEEIDLKVYCDTTYNHNFEDTAKLSINLTGKNNNKLALITGRNHQRSVRLGVEVTLSLDATPQILHENVVVEDSIEENLYESINVFDHCASCLNNVLNCEVYTCSLGHIACKKCKSPNCRICSFQLNSNLLQFCKNYVRGCTELFPAGDIKKHEIDCEFNDFNCPLCDSANNLNILVAHFQQTHNPICSNEFNAIVTDQDETWFFACFNKLFRCKYYYLRTSIEFVVTYVGSNDKACDYKYSVTVLPKNLESVTKQAKCLGWNDASLGKAIVFEVANNRKKFEVRVSISIVPQV